KIKPSNRQQAVKVKIKFNPADCSVIHVHFKRGKTWDYIPFHNENAEYSKGKSFKLSREIRLYAREQGYKFELERDRIMAAARHMQHIQSLFKRGKLTRAQKLALTKLNELHREAANEADQE